MRLILTMSAILLASGCATVPAAPVAIEADSISFETGPCFGTCPVYKVTVRPDGTGMFEGRRFTAVTGERAFRVSPAQYRAFEAQLAPLRPAEGEVREECMTVSDMASVQVTWFSQIGNSQGYYLYFGCDRERNQAARERLQAAPALLPIADLIGRR